MNFLFASDSFKGTLSSQQTAALLTKAAKSVFPPCSCRSLSVADGGEGTMEAVIESTQGTLISVPVHGPLMKPINSAYGQLDKDRAIIEMAQASGLPLIPRGSLDPKKATSYGTGELIADALERGFSDITIAVGGSATNDGGMGCMRALGVKFYDSEGAELSGAGADLIRLHKIDVSHLHPAVGRTHFTVMCDVTNPLCGEHGATYTFGPQKGASPALLQELELGMCNYRDILARDFHLNPDTVPGSGAAGGLAAALLVFLNAELRSGIETVLDLIDFDHYLADTDLVITGEGRCDWQSCYGKVMHGIGMRCKKAGVPAIGIVGSMGPGSEDLYACGIHSLMTTVNSVMPLEDALKDAKSLYYGAALRTFQMLKAGMTLK